MRNLAEWEAEGEFEDEAAYETGAGAWERSADEFAFREC